MFESHILILRDCFNIGYSNAVALERVANCFIACLTFCCSLSLVPGLVVNQDPTSDKPAVFVPVIPKLASDYSPDVDTESASLVTLMPL